ncbi:MAG TPA: TonB-dependent receptor, partial [Oceanipulchritudo sp.]|nr:TonB-dependent receptor [Oceanipulchritudo sp.]
MNKNYKKLWLLLPCAVIPFQGIFAQNADDDGEVIDLSPFVVTGDGDIGYQATSTLAGTRLRSDLRDIGSSISIVNEEFLQDTGATTIADVLLFTPNTEVGGIGGNFSASQGFGAGNPIPELQRDNQQGGITRVRGLAQADLTRDYFITDVPFDAYNTDRITVQRGANSALFGLGSPGGIVNNTTIRANFLGNVGRVKLETDEHGTQRASIRYNHEVIEDKLAIRIAGLYDDNQYEQKQAYEVDKRLFAAATWNITENLRLSANIEHGSRNAARPDFTPPNDGITPWLLAGKPIAENPRAAAELFRGTDDFFPSEASNSTNSRLLSVAVAGASSGFTNFYADPTNPDPTFGGTQFVRRNRGTPDNTEYMMIMPRPMNRIMKLTGGFYPGGATIDPAIAGFFNSGNVDRQILDRSIFDYRKNLFSGGASTQSADFRIISGALEGAWWDNKIGFELAAYDQQFDSNGFNMMQGIEQRTLYIDPNRYLIAQDGSGNWIPNPGFGKPAMGGGYGGNDLYTNRESLRATVFAELAADDFLEESLVTRILGRLKLTGVLQERSSDGKQAYGGRGGVDPQTAANALAGGDIFGLSNATFRKGMQFTLPDSGNVDYLSMTSLNDARGANIGGVTFGGDRSIPPSPSTFVGWDSVSESFVSFETPVYTLRDNDNFLTSFFSGKDAVEIDSQVLVGQHYLWDDTIVLMGTWRNDRQKSGSVGAPRWEPYGDGRSLA